MFQYRKQKKFAKSIDSLQNAEYYYYIKFTKGDDKLLPIKIKLSAVRVNADKSQQDMADEMGVTRMTISNWESGKAKMSEADIQMYARICNFPRENIFLPY